VVVVVVVVVLVLVVTVVVVVVVVVTVVVLVVFPRATHEQTGAVALLPRTAQSDRGVWAGRQPSRGDGVK